MPQRSLGSQKLIYRSNYNISDHQHLRRNVIRYSGRNKQSASLLPTPVLTSNTNTPIQLSASLPSLGDLQLFPDALPSGGHAYYLTKITKVILLNFLELTTILSADPSAATPKLEDIKRLFLNAHHLINMYRPHQARETLIMMMEEQLEEGRREMEECERVRGKVEESLREMEGLVRDSEVGGGANGVGKNDAANEQDDTQRLWQMIHELDHD
jgi:mediator of RNA polymerase II transcription subunit 7